MDQLRFPRYDFSAGYGYSKEYIEELVRLRERLMQNRVEPRRKAMGDGR